MRLKIHPLVFVVGALAVWLAAANFFFAMLVAVLLHELGHYVAARCCGLVAESVTLTPFGGALKLDARFLTARQYTIIPLAGPFSSFCWTVFFGALLWLFPVVFIALEYLVVANFLVGLINILPVYPLDGGKLLGTLVPEKTLLIWSNVVLAVLGVSGLFARVYVLVLYAVVTLLQINWPKSRASVYRDKLSPFLTPKIGPVVRCVVAPTTTLLAAYKMVQGSRPTEFVVPVRHCTFYETDLEQWLLTYPSVTPVGEVLARK